MKTLQNNFTTPEQSKRLLELGVPADSADCFHTRSSIKIIPKGAVYSKYSWILSNGDKAYPCWSVGRLMEIIAECYQVDMPFRYFVRGGMMESLINTFIDLRGEIDLSKIGGMSMKEWKGNSNSAHAAIAAHNGKGKSDRQEDDFYATDSVALEKLLVHSSCYLRNIFYDRPVIWEPACGNGNLAFILDRHDLPTFASDLKDRGYGVGNIDFLQNKNFIDAQIILTNPPYSLATEFIEHALEILPERGLYIALMNITYLAGQKRYQRVYSKGSLREIYVFSKRVECWKNGERPKDKCGSIANYAWYVFQKGYKGQPTLYWL